MKTLTENEKIELIKECIATPDGWKNLADSINMSDKPLEARESCLEFLSKIAKESDDSVDDKVKLFSTFKSQLEQHLNDK